MEAQASAEADEEATHRRSRPSARRSPPSVDGARARPTRKGGREAGKQAAEATSERGVDSSPAKRDRG
jgi:hypothetical protein